MTKSELPKLLIQLNNLERIWLMYKTWKNQKEEETRHKWFITFCMQTRAKPKIM